MALAGVAPWVEHQPANQKVTGLIPGQGTCLGCRPGPQLGVCERSPSLHLSLKIINKQTNKILKKKKKEEVIYRWKEGTKIEARIS